MKIELIETGYFYADGGAMFGAIPKTSWVRRYESDGKNGCILAMRSALVKTDDGHVIVIDNGAGTKQLKKLGGYRLFNLMDLRTELASNHVCPEEVTDMVFTHLHFDHCGYTTQLLDKKYSLAFPNATHWVSRAQWENSLHPHPLEKASYFQENMQAVFDAGKLKLIDSDTKLCPSVELRLFDGHTKGQIAVYMSGEKRTYVFAGDVVPLEANLSPDWISAYDVEPLISYNEKIRMLEEAADKEQAIIFCHDAYMRCCTIRRVQNFYRRSEEIAELEI